MIRRTLGVWAGLQALIILICSAAASWKQNSLWDYLFAFVHEDTLCALINDSEQIHRIQALLLQTVRHPSEIRYNFQIRLDESEPIPIPGQFLGWPITYDTEEGPIGFEVTGDEDALDHVLGFSPGDSLIFHRVAPGENGPVVSASISKIIYHGYYESAHVLLKCEPVDSMKARSLKTSAWSSALIAYSRRRAKDLWSELRDRPIEVIDTSCPAHIEKKVAELAEALIPANVPEVSQGHEVVPIEHVDQSWKRREYYVGIAWHGDKVRTGKLYLLDARGEIKQEIDGGYCRVLGVADFGRRSSQAIAVFTGSGYGGGVQLLMFTSRHRDPPELAPKMYKTTVWD